MWDNAGAIIAGTAAVVAVLGSIVGLGWWLRDQFSLLGRRFFGEMEKSRELNQRRHEENLKSLETIRLALARAGFWTSGK